MWKKKLFQLASKPLTIYMFQIFSVYLFIVFFPRELGIGIVPYGPLGSGFLASGPKLMDNLTDCDTRKVCTYTIL